VCTPSVEGEYRQLWPLVIIFAAFSFVHWDVRDETLLLLLLLRTGFSGTHRSSNLSSLPS
jgi:hypothetical protein